MLKILAELKGAMGRPTERGEPGFSEVLAEYRDAYLLCIDDVGVEKLTPFVADQFYGIVNERIWKGLPTFMTTNLTLPEQQVHLSPRVWSRLLPKVDLVEVGGPDLRERRRCGSCAPGMAGVETDGKTLGRARLARRGKPAARFFSSSQTAARAGRIEPGGHRCPPGGIWPAATIRRRSEDFYAKGLGQWMPLSL
jgi:hypothetical protein